MPPQSVASSICRPFHTEVPTSAPCFLVTCTLPGTHTTLEQVQPTGLSVHQTLHTFLIGIRVNKSVYTWHSGPYHRALPPLLCIHSASSILSSFALIQSSTVLAPVLSRPSTVTCASVWPHTCGFKSHFFRQNIKDAFFKLQLHLINLFYFTLCIYWLLCVCVFMLFILLFILLPTWSDNLLSLRGKLGWCWIKDKTHVQFPCSLAVVSLSIITSLDSTLNLLFGTCCCIWPWPILVYEHHMYIPVEDSSTLGRCSRGLAASTGGCSSCTTSTQMEEQNQSLCNDFQRPQ